MQKIEEIKKGKERTQKEQGLAEMEDVLDKMCKQEDTLVVAVKHAEENNIPI